MSEELTVEIHLEPPGLRPLFTPQERGQIDAFDTKNVVLSPIATVSLDTFLRLASIATPWKPSLPDELRKPYDHVWIYGGSNGVWEKGEIFVRNSHGWYVALRGKA